MVAGAETSRNRAATGAVVLGQRSGNVKRGARAFHGVLADDVYTPSARARARALLVTGLLFDIPRTRRLSDLCAPDTPVFLDVCSGPGRRRGDACHSLARSVAGHPLRMRAGSSRLALAGCPSMDASRTLPAQGRVHAGLYTTQARLIPGTRGQQQPKTGSLDGGRTTQTGKLGFPTA